MIWLALFALAVGVFFVIAGFADSRQDRDPRPRVTQEPGRPMPSWAHKRTARRPKHGAGVTR